MINATTQIAVTNIFAKRSLVQRRFIAFLGAFSLIIYTFLNMGPVTWGGADVSFAILSSWVFLTVGTSTALFALINPEKVVIAFNEDAPTDTILPPRLFRRLGLCEMQVSITRLTVNDHYVLVGISDGSEQRLLMRLSDAIAEMDDVVGFIAHRSYWVSRMHVKGLVLEGKREMLGRLRADQPNLPTCPCRGGGDPSGKGIGREPVSTVIARGPKSVRKSGCRADNPPV